MFKIPDHEDQIVPLPKNNIEDVNSGLPPLDLAGQPASYFEFWPSWLFYVPVFFYWLRLSIRYKSLGLPMLANPNIELGGMVGESKSAILDLAGDKAKTAILPYVKTLRGGSDVGEEIVDALQCCAELGFTFPLVVKPDLGCRGVGVRVIYTEAELVDYLTVFPVGRHYLLQKLAPYSAEAGVFYERYPNEERGNITSLALKYVPWVTGDGRSTLSELITCDIRAFHLGKIYMERNKDQLDRVPYSGEKVPLAFAGSHCRGAIFRDGKEFITSTMTETLDEIMKDIESFHYGRLDIKFASLEEFQDGRGFAIIEINGASSEAAHIWDARASLSHVFRVLFRQYRVLFQMGAQLKERGYSVPSAATLIKVWWRELWLADNYPPSN